MELNKSNSRLSIREILSDQDWQNKKYLQLSGEQMTEIVGSFSGVPEAAYRAAMKLDEVLNENFINKMRMCRRSLERSFPFRYEQVVLAVAVALDSLKRKILSVSDTDRGSFIEAELLINYLYIFIGVDKGLLKFEIVDQGPSATLVRATSEVIGINLVRKDWGRGRRNMEAILNKASQYLDAM